MNLAKLSGALKNFRAIREQKVPLRPTPLRILYQRLGEGTITRPPPPVLHRRYRSRSKEKIILKIIDVPQYRL